MPSFDVVCEADIQEIKNAVDQAQRELRTRYDLKDSGAEIDVEAQGGTPQALNVLADSEQQAGAVADVLVGKLVKRKVDPRFFERGRPVTSPNGRVTIVLRLQQGIPQTLAKDLVKQIKALPVKVQPQIRGEELRISGKKRDDLQVVIRELTNLNLDRPLSFANFRD